MEIIALIVLVLAIAFGYLYAANDSDPKLFSGFFIGKFLMKAAIARRYSEEDFEIEMIGVDLVRMNNILQNLTNKDVNEINKINDVVNELNFKLDARIRALGLAEVVQIELERQYAEMTKSTGKK